MIGLIGSDLEGKILSEQLDQRNIVYTNLVESENRPTTVKSRIMAQNQQVARADREFTEDLSDSSNQKLADAIRSTINDIDGLILEDYNKGVLNVNSIPEIIGLANKAGKPIYVDPKESNLKCIIMYGFLNLIYLNSKMPIPERILLKWQVLS